MSLSDDDVVGVGAANIWPVGLHPGYTTLINNTPWYDDGGADKLRLTTGTPMVEGSRYVQDWSAQNFVQDVRRRFKPRTSTQTNPIPGLTLRLTPTLWRARGRQGQSRGPAACFGGRLKKQNGRPKGQP